MTMKDSSNKTWSLVLTFLVYMTAAAVGIGVFMSTSYWPLWAGVLTADVAATVVVFGASLLLDNSSAYDPYWSVLPMVLLPLLMAYTNAWSGNAVVILVAVELWGLRLTGLWCWHFTGYATYQDWRYVKLRKETGSFYPLVNLIGIHLVPTLVVYGCILPFVGLLQYGLALPFDALSLIGFAVMLTSMTIETIADIQKDLSRSQGNRGIVKTGLWKYARHPNYFGEIMFWWGLYIAVVAVAPALWWTFLGPLINTALFAFASIPMAEKESAIRHPDEWEQYRQSTRPLI